MPSLPRSFKRSVRDVLLNPSLHKVVGSGTQEQMLRLAYLGRFSEWIDETGLKPDFESRDALYQYVYENESLEKPVDYLEFGVFEGRSMRWWSEHIKHPDARFVGFDCFEGIPEAWASRPPGTFTAEGKIPDIDDERVSFEVGLFQDTLPGFVESHTLDRPLVLNLDPDLYSSTLFVLATLGQRLKRGDVLIFDEIGSVREPTAEFRALLDFASAFRFSYTPIGASPQYKVIAVRID
ncbi:MAG: TylF/MycF/NovP-related O-methyltransferase [Myxococcota bacterium]|nr:TylF/MycF/NovP-related O-methyltransferase [Myxococcota bacterium]